MAEEVEISNVGGENGVASEATLASLTRAIEKLAASTGRDPKKEAGKVQKAHNDAVKNGITVVTKNRDALEEKTKAVEKATNATNRYSSAMLGVIGGLLGSVAGSVLNLGKALLDGGSSLTDFAQHLPLVGSYLSVFTQIIDQNIEAVRSMSQAGATFGNGLTDIRHIAAQAAIPLSDFVDLISSNSAAMKLFGSDVAAGARNFATMSKELRQGPGRSLMSLGFTSAELNELLIDYAELQALSFNRDRIQGRITATNAAAFGEELLKLSAISGKRRKQIEDEMKSQSQDIRMIAATSRMTGDQADIFRANLGTVGASSQALSNALLDFEDGIPTDDVTRQLMRMSETFRTQGQNIENLDPQQLHNFLYNVREDLIAEAERLGKPLSEIVAGVPGLADAMGILGESSAYAAEMTDQQYEAYLRRVAIEEAQGKALMEFSETMNTVRGELMSAFIESGVLGLVQGYLEDLAETLSDFVRDPSFKEGLTEIATTIKEFIDNFRKFDLGTALFGGTGTMDTPAGNKTEEVEGLFADLFGEGGVISSAFTSVAPQLTTMFTDILGSAFGAIGGGITTWFDENWGKILTGALVGVGVLLAAPFVGLGAVIVAPVLAAFAGIATYFGLADIEEWISNAWDAVTGIFSGIGDWWSGISFTDMFNNTWNAVTGIFSGIGDWWSRVSFSNIFDDLWNRITSVFDFELPDVGSFLPDWMRSDETVEERELNANAANEFAGYGGMATGGIATGPKSGYPMELHGTEAVVPLPNGRSIPVDFQKNMFDNMRSTPTNEIPKIEIDNIAILSENIQDMKTELVKSINTTNQSSQETIKQLNKLMSQVLEVMQEMAEDSGNIERNTRSMGSNIANGRISAVR